MKERSFSVLTGKNWHFVVKIQCFNKWKAKVLVFALIGISGVGKSYLTDYILDKCNGMEKLIAVTTRKKRKQEIEGVDKYFLSSDKFEAEKEKLIFVRRMYGAYYGFWAKDVNVERHLVAELYYKDYLLMKKINYPVKGIYVWTSENEQRSNIIKKRYSNKLDFLTRETRDVYNNIVHKIMLKSGLFDYAVCNHYDEASPKNILRFVESMRKQNDSG